MRLQPFRGRKILADRDELTEQRHWRRYDRRMPTETPLPREEWVAKFAGEVQNLRDLWHAGKFVKALAQQEWLVHQNEDPVKVAQAWASRQGGPAKR